MIFLQLLIALVTIFGACLVVAFLVDLYRAWLDSDPCVDDGLIHCTEEEGDL